MKKRVVFWKRFNYQESGYDLVELFEDGTIIQRTFENRKRDQKYYQETNKTTTQATGKINVEKINFGDNHQVKKADVSKHLKLLETFELKDWEEARKTVKALHNESIEDLTLDYHTMLVLDEDSLPEKVRNELNRFDYPIVKFRFNFNEDTLHRSRLPEEVSIEFVPFLNEHIYFHHIPAVKYLNMTGDDLFALHTKSYDNDPKDDVFWNYVDNMMEEIKENMDYYRTLISKQRERRAMLETEVIGDLYPR